MFMFCKVNIFLFSTRLNMITASVGQWLVGRWVGGSVRKWSVVGWSVVGGLVVGGFNKSPSVKVFSAEPFEWPFFIQEILCREKVDINL